MTICYINRCSVHSATQLTCLMQLSPTALTVLSVHRIDTHDFCAIDGTFNLAAAEQKL